MMDKISPGLNCEADDIKSNMFRVTGIYEIIFLNRYNVAPSVRIASNEITPYATRIAFQSNPLMIRGRIAFTARLIGFTLETVLIQSGIIPGLSETRAVLMNSNGKVRNPAIPNTVSEFLVFNPKAREIPDQAKLKYATVAMTRTYPTKPVAG
jgi:hypothetical protein